MSNHVYKKKICQYCGKEYYHWNGKSKYCEGPHYATCKICGKQFEITPGVTKTVVCSKECKRELTRRTNLDRYGTEVASKNVEVRRKISKATKEAQPKVQATNMIKYGVPVVSQNKSIGNKISNSLKSKKSRSKFESTMIERYGVPYAMQSKELQSKHAKNCKCVSRDGQEFDSKDEKDVYEFLVEVCDTVERQVPIQYEHEGTLHVSYIDFCADGILIEVKGSHLLKGIWDYSGVPISRKLQLYREHHVIVVTYSESRNIFGKPNSKESNGLKYLDKCPNPLIGVDIDLFRNNPVFPYRDDRPPVFYDVKVSGNVSSHEAFYDVHTRWDMIVNRILYSGGFIDASHVLNAMNVTRTCKQPSWFSKSFAKHIMETYTSTDVIVDTFAGWGARYDACVELGKLYVGCDVNSDLVDWHKSKGRDIQLNDAKTFTYDKPCSVVVCPPYTDVEVYTENQDVALTQCQWLQIVMNNVPYAAEYVLVCKVVDTGWEKFIVETKTNKSHFGVNNEYVLCVPGTCKEQYTLSSEDLLKLENQNKELQKYRSFLRKSKTCKGKRCWVSNKLTGETKQVPESMIQEFTQYGWVQGRSSFKMKDYKWITNGTQDKRVKSCQVDEYLSNGWKLGRGVATTRGFKFVNNGKERRYVSPSECDELLNNGWSIGYLKTT